MRVAILFPRATSVQLTQHVHQTSHSLHLCTTNFTLYYAKKLNYSHTIIF